MKQLRTVTYTNPETGEYKEKKNWVDIQFDSEEGYLFWNRKSSIRSFLDAPLPIQFTWSEKGRIQELKYYILRSNQLLVYRGHNVIKPLLIPQMSNLLEMSERQCKTLIRKMKDYHIIKEISFGGIIYYAFSPIYAFKGKRLSLDTYLMFQNELKDVLPMWVVKKFTEQARELKPDIRIIK